MRSVPSTQNAALCLGAALISAATLGCQASATAPPAVQSSALAPANVNLVIGDAKALEARIAAHKGEVVFVDYWATWCLPCVEGLPHTVALAKEYKGQGLATIAVSFDQIDDEAKVREFLAKQGAEFEHLLSKYDGASQKAAVDFDIEPLPEYRLYDRQGKLRQKWANRMDEIKEEVESKIKELLAENP
jgi:thiol-disulfide isomerase/thioredoxin